MFRQISGSLTNLPRRGWLWLVLAFISIFFIFLWHLGNLTPGMSANEVNYTNGDKTISQIISNPVNVPHKLVQFGIHHLAPTHPSLLRLASIGFALIFCFGFYRLATGWFGRPIGLFSTIMFASLPLFVISARQASAEVLFFSPVVFIALYNWLLKAKQPALAWLVLCLSAGIFLFTPGMLVWLIGAGLIGRRSLIKAIANLSIWQTALGLLMSFAGLAGLAAASALHHNLVKPVFLVPPTLPNWLRLCKNIGWMISSLVLKTGHSDPLIVGRLPLLNIVLIALLVFGIYAMQGVTRRKTICLSLSIVYAILAAGLNNRISLLALGLPAIAIFITAGLRYIYIEWRSVFPRNPVPKTFALVLIAIVAAVQLDFGLRYSLVAWPATPATRAAYVLK